MVLVLCCDLDLKLLQWDILLPPYQIERHVMMAILFNFSIVSLFALSQHFRKTLKNNPFH